MNDEKKIDDGGPAFPETPLSGGHPGMTLRDYFAAKAMAGIVADGGYWENGPSACDDMASDAYRVADAMLEARKR